MTAVLDRSREAAFTEIDARDAVRAITAAECLPEPVFVLTSARRGAVSVVLADRDAVDEWAAMLDVSVARRPEEYGVHWSERATHPLLPGLFIDFWCDVPPVKWQRRELAAVAA